MNVVVGGGRYMTDRGFVHRTLDALHALYGITRLAHGGCTGADLLAAEWAIEHGIVTVQYEARWNEEGRAAGPKRNRRMLEQEKPDLVIAFPGGTGTRNLTQQARLLHLRDIQVEGA